MATHKDIQTKRGLSYHYLSIPSQPGKPTILLLHGFPSTTRDWRFQIEYFSAKGYGLIVPDMLGYGRTDKPLDVEYYSWKDMAADVLDILEAEALENVIVVGHDWGCSVTSRLAVLPSDRFIGFAFLCVGYMDISPEEFNLEAIMAAMKAKFGSEILGYWTLLNRDDAASFIEAKIDSFLTVAHPDDPVLWKTVMNIPGALVDWLGQDNRKPRPDYLSEGDYNAMREALLQNGLSAPLNWYKATAAGINRGEMADLESTLTKPAFYGAALRDYVCLPSIFKFSFPTSTDLTIVDFDTGHWPQLEQPEEVNRALEGWIESKLE